MQGNKFLGAHTIAFLKTLIHRNKIHGIISHYFFQTGGDWHQNIQQSLTLDIDTNLLLKFKQMPINMLLKPLVGIIYTKLFKAVLLKKGNKKY